MICSFQDLDDQGAYDTLKAQFRDWSCRNFIVDFTSATASAAYNVDIRSLGDLLKQKKANKSVTRWINIWNPELQSEELKQIGEQYGFSSRLLAIMRSRHDSQYQKEIEMQQKQAILPEKAAHITEENRSSDIESYAGTMASSTIVSQRTDINRLSHYRIADEVWHYNSVDWGERYHCIGFNSLHDVEITSGIYNAMSGDKPPHKRLGSKPPGKRLWTWLVLCDDGTVISIFENPFPEVGMLDADQARILEITRRNVDNVFRHLSKATDIERKEDFMSVLNIRRTMPSQARQTSAEVTDQPSLLFYYLFDDWRTTYSLVAQKDDQYGSQLAELRRSMFERPSVQLVEDLHHVGQQLAVLKRIYESYSIIIDRLLENQSLHSGDSPGENSTLGVQLRPAASVRFERLRDRIRLLALSEVQSCLDEKESLVFLNFNLITLKQSAAVERLTRITILLAKVTILFMPVSLMTAYFSTQIVELQHTFTVVSYWISFGVIFVLSFVFLIVFGRLSDTVEGKPIYRSLTRIFYDKSRGAYEGRKERWKQQAI